MRLGYIAAVALICGLCSAPARADIQADEGVTADVVADVLRGKGFTAEIGTDSGGDPKVTSSAAGSRFVILFYGCNHTPRCTSLQFYAGFNTTDVSQKKMNDWNKAHRYTRAYLDNVVNPCIEMDLIVGSGNFPGLLEQYLTLWTSSLGRFQADIGW